MKNNYYYELVTGNPIRYKNLYIYQISFDDICTFFGYDNFSYLMMPFCLTAEYIKETTGLDVQDENIFKEIILKDKNLLENVCQILLLFCKCEKITLFDQTLQLYDKESNDVMFKITNENFNDISDILLMINGKEKLKIEKPPDGLSERQLDIWMKIHEGRKREAKKNHLQIYDIINICEFGGKSHISVDEIKKWSFWKLINCYKSIAGDREYEDNLRIGIESHDLSSIEKDKHWLKKLMIRD